MSERPKLSLAPQNPIQKKLSELEYTVDEQREQIAKLIDGMLLAFSLIKELRLATSRKPTPDQE